MHTYLLKKCFIIIIFLYCLINLKKLYSLSPQSCTHLFLHKNSSTHQDNLFHEITSLCLQKETSKSLLKLEKKIDQMGHFFKKKSDQTQTCLLKQCYEKDNYKTFVLLLKKGCNPNRLDSNGHTLLVRSIFWGRLEYIASLLKYGVDVTQKSVIGEPLYYVVQSSNHLKGSKEIHLLLTLMLIRGSDPHLKSTTLIGIDREKAQTIHESYFEDLDTTTTWPLLHLAKKQSFELMLTLLKYGVNVFQKDYDGNNVLHIFARKGVYYNVYNEKAKEVLKKLKQCHVEELTPNSQRLTVVDMLNRVDQKKHKHLIGSRYDYEKNILDHLKTLPLEEALFQFQELFPLPYDRHIGASHILWEMKDIMAEKIKKEKPSVTHFFLQYRSKTPLKSVYLRSPQGDSLVSLDMLFLFCYGLKNHDHHCVQQFSRNILFQLLQKDKNGMWIYKTQMTSIAQNYLLFFDEPSLKKGHLKLYIPAIHQRWQEKNSYLLAWFLMMEQEESSELLRYDWASNRPRQLSHPHCFYERMCECAVERMAFNRFAQNLYPHMNLFNQCIQTRLETQTSLTEISTFQELITYLSRIGEKHKLKHLKDCLSNDWDHLSWEAHGRSLVLNPTSDTTMNKLEYGLKFRKKEESSSDFSDYEILKECEKEQAWSHLRTLTKIRIKDPLKSQLNVYINTHQIDQEEEFDINGEAFLYESQGSYFVYANQIEDRTSFLKSIERNMRETIRLYRQGYIRNEMTVSQHDIGENTPRKTLYYPSGFAINFWIYNKGVVENRTKMLSISNFGLSIRDPSNYLKGDSFWSPEKIKKLTEANFIYSYSQQSFIEKMICDALVELADIAFEHYLDFNQRPDNKNIKEEQMLQEVLETIVRPILEGNKPQIKPFLWDALIHELSREVLEDIRLFKEEFSQTDAVIMKKNTRENFLQNMHSVISRCYAILGAFLNEDSLLIEILQSKQTNIDTNVGLHSYQTQEALEERMFVLSMSYEDRLKFLKKKKRRGVSLSFYFQLLILNGDDSFLFLFSDLKIKDINIIGESLRLLLILLKEKEFTALYHYLIKSHDYSEDIILKLHDIVLLSTIGKKNVYCIWVQVLFLPLSAKIKLALSQNLTPYLISKLCLGLFFLNEKELLKQLLTKDIDLKIIENVHYFVLMELFFMNISCELYLKEVSTYTQGKIVCRAVSLGDTLLECSDIEEIRSFLRFVHIEDQRETLIKTAISLDHLQYFKVLTQKSLKKRQSIFDSKKEMFLLEIIKKDAINIWTYLFEKLKLSLTESKTWTQLMFQHESWKILSSMHSSLSLGLSHMKINQKLLSMINVQRRIHILDHLETIGFRLNKVDQDLIQSILNLYDEENRYKLFFVNNIQYLIQDLSSHDIQLLNQAMKKCLSFKMPCLSHPDSDISNLIHILKKKGVRIESHFQENEIEKMFKTLKKVAHNQIIIQRFQDRWIHSLPLIMNDTQKRALEKWIIRCIQSHNLDGLQKILEKPFSLTYKIQKIILEALINNNRADLLSFFLKHHNTFICEKISLPSLFSMCQGREVFQLLLKNEVSIMGLNRLFKLKNTSLHSQVLEFFCDSHYLDRYMQKRGENFLFEISASNGILSSSLCKRILLICRSKGWNIQKNNSLGLSPLLYAIQLGQYHYALALIQAGVHYQQKDNDMNEAMDHFLLAIQKERIVAHTSETIELMNILMAKEKRSKESFKKLQNKIRKSILLSSSLRSKNLLEKVEITLFSFHQAQQHPHSYC